MGILKRITEWATSPWGQSVPIHVAWFLIWVAGIAGLLFLTVHAIYVRYFARAEEFAGSDAPARAAELPARIPRHSLAARLFHWIMAASMFTLLFTAFLPRVGVQFNWVTYHWIAGAVLTVSIIFHVIHASFWLDFWAIWPDRVDLVDAWRRVQRFMGRPAPPHRHEVLNDASCPSLVPARSRPLATSRTATAALVTTLPFGSFTLMWRSPVAAPWANADWRTSKNMTAKKKRRDVDVAFIGLLGASA